MAPGILIPTVVDFANSISTSTKDKELQKGNGNTNTLLQVEHPSVISDDFRPIQFDGAAAQQLAPIIKHEAPVTSSSLVITSPYNIPLHHLDLNRLPNIQDRILTLALTGLHPIRADYATGPYTDIFNWEEVWASLRHLSKLAGHAWKEQDYYVVIFRSQLKADFEKQLLWDLDRESHREAVESGGLLKYWFGAANEDRRNLATCIWRNRDDARAGGTGPWHVRARAAGRVLYDRITFSTWKLTIKDGGDEWSINEWKH